MFEYPYCTATVRTAVVEVEGMARRQLVVCGDRGTIEIRPLEPPQLRLALDEPGHGFQAGYQDVPLPPMTGRYDDQLKEFARIVRGEIENPYSYEHDFLVHESLLKACGYSLDETTGSSATA